MKTNDVYFFCRDIPDETKDCELSLEEARHAARVLRLKEGHLLTLLDGSGTLAVARVSGVEGGRKAPRVTCRVVQRCVYRPPRVTFHVLVALPRGNRADDIFRQATELGVWEISPLICDRSVATPASSKVEGRWRHETIAAMKQSGNVFLPWIHPPISFQNALEQTDGRGIVGDSQGAQPTLTPAWDKENHIDVWIGPEGGFSEIEKDGMVEKGLHFLRLGDWTLRVDTAVTALMGWLKGKVHGDDTCFQSGE